MTFTIVRQLAKTYMEYSILARLGIIISFVVSLSFISCEYESPKDTPDEIVEESGPKIEVLNLPNLVETVTDVNVRITDPSSVSTIVKIDGVEIHTDTKKEFIFSIDPFEFPSGPKSIEIITVNTNQNESVTNRNVEFKRLLYRDQTFYAKENYFQGKRFISLHSLEGKLLYFKEINSVEDGTFYASDNLEKQDIIVSRYEFGTNLSNFITIASYTDIKAGTTVTDNQNTDSPDFFVKDSSFSFQVNGITDLVADNYNSMIVSVDPNIPNSYQLIYSNDQTKEFLIGTSATIENPIENYKYVIIDDLNKTNYEIEDFKTASDNAIIDIPVDADFRFNFLGYKNEDAFRDYQYNEIYVSRVAPDKKVVVPVLEEFTVYESLLAYSYDRTDVYLFQKGIDKTLEAPKVGIVQNGNELEFIGEYDYSNIEFDDSNGTDVLMWGFTNEYKQSQTLPFYEFEVPAEIKALLSAKSLSMDLTTANGDFAFLKCDLIKGGKYVYTKQDVLTKPNLSPERDGFRFTRRLDLN